MTFARASSAATTSFRAFSAAWWMRRGSESNRSFNAFASGFASDGVVLGTTDVYHGRGR